MVSWLLFSRGSPGSLRSATAADHQQCPPQGVFTPDLTPRFRTRVGVATDQWPAGLTGPEKELSLYVVKRLGVTGWWMGGGAYLFCCLGWCRNWPKDSQHRASVALPYPSFSPRHQTRAHHWPHTHTGQLSFTQHPHFPLALGNTSGTVVAYTDLCKELSI